jgi:hypothetical protein
MEIDYSFPPSIASGVMPELWGERITLDRERRRSAGEGNFGVIFAVLL